MWELLRIQAQRRLDTHKKSCPFPARSSQMLGSWYLDQQQPLRDQLQSNTIFKKYI